MAKPSWSDAPEWAQWLAMDDDGTWYWFEDEPKFRRHCWFGLRKVELARGGSHTAAHESLEPRPQEPPNA